MTLLLRGGPPGGGSARSAQLQVQRIGAQRLGGGSTQTALVQAMVAVEPGTPATFSINGVDCDAWPVTRDHVTGAPDIYRVAAPVANPGGVFSTIGVATGDDQLVITQESGTAGLEALKPCNLEGLQLHVLVAGMGSERHAAMPFQVGHPSILSHRVRRGGGRYLEQTETLVRFVKQGVTTPSEREDEVLLAYVYRTTRCDYRAETLDVVALNAKWSASEDAYTVTQVGDGEVFFGFVDALGVEAQDTVEFIAPRLHQTVTPEYARLVNVPSGFPDAWHQFPPGSWFARRLVVYRTSEVTPTVARDIVRRCDWAMTEGDLGYCSGNWGGFMPLPRYSRLTPQRGGATVYDELIDKGNEFLARRMQSITVDGAFDAEPDGGWKQPTGGKDPREPGEGYLDLVGMEAPTNGHLTALLIECDQFAERNHLAMIDVDSLRPARLSDLLLPDGRLPYGFGVQYRSHEYPVLHFLPPATPIQGDAALAPTTLGWNTLPDGSTAPFADVTNWLESSSGNWGPIYHTHHGRELTTFRATFYALDDPVAELGLRFRGRACNLAYAHHDVRTDGPVQRFSYSREEGCLYHIWNGILPGQPLYAGGWPAYKATNARSFAHAIGSITALHHFEDDAGRASLRGNGDAAHDLFLLVGRIVDHCCTWTGLLTQNSSSATNLVFSGDLPDVAAKREAIPNKARAEHAAAGITEQYGATSVMHQTYAGQWMHVVGRILDATPGGTGLLDRMIAQPDILESAAEAMRPGERYGFPHALPASIGTEGVANPPMTEAEARAGGAFWATTDSQPHLDDGVVNWKPWACGLAVQSYRQHHGDWGGTLRLLKRQFAAPDSLSDAALLRELWAFVGSEYASGHTSADYKLQLLAVIGLLQSLGVQHPDVAAA